MVEFIELFLLDDGDWRRHEEGGTKMPVTQLLNSWRVHYHYGISSKAKTARRRSTASKSFHVDVIVAATTPTNPARPLLLIIIAIPPLILPCPNP